MGISIGTSIKWLFIHSIQIILEIGIVGLWGEEKTSVPMKNLLEQGEKNQEQTQPTSDTQSRKQTLDHVGGRREYSTLTTAPYPCSPLGTERNQLNHYIS